MTNSIISSTSSCISLPPIFLHDVPLRRNINFTSAHHTHYVILLVHFRIHPVFFLRNKPYLRAGSPHIRSSFCALHFTLLHLHF